ncbi:MAG: hypothetical protein JNK85_14720 [Verrucomicrobiales bacterium]|nr:hypothetical protein [Verrucomicrobiales bacterium]
MKRSPCLPSNLIVLALLAVASGLLQAAESPPSYSVRFLGAGSVVAINNADTVVGLTTSPTTGAQSPWISIAGTPWAPLPLPSGATSAFPTDLNDAGVVVGVASFPAGRRAIRWVPTGSTFSVELLPLLPGEVASYATGINNLGQIVGARAGILGTPFGFGWLYSDAGGVVGLEATYGWFATPNDINDAGVILAGTQTLDLATRIVADVGLAGPPNYNAIGGVALNDAGQILGSASLRSTSLNVISVFRFLPGSGWEFIAGSSRYTVASDINNLGDIGWGELGAGVSLNGIGSYALGSLLDPSAIAEGWTITGNGCLLNDQRMIATLGRNSLTGQAGAVLLAPVGVLPTPAAPTDLTATPHPATAAEPYVSIDLSWINGDIQLTRTYEMERRVEGTAAWTTIPLVPPAMSTFHQDTTVSPATTYEYRVRAIGVAGAGAWSAIASATSPAAPLDTTPPVVTILTPANGATVSGTIPIATRATDDVGVEYLEISYWNQYLGQQIILGSVPRTEALDVSWDTTGLTPATYTVEAFAHDAVGNWTRTQVQVNVAAPAPKLRVANIILTGRTQGSRVTISGLVQVRDGGGSVVRNATVTVQWRLPNGSTPTASARTDSMGRATFSVSGTRGTYQLTVTGVTKAGHVFDPAGSVLSKTITK